VTAAPAVVADRPVAGMGLRQWAALAVVYVVWGSTYLAIKIGIETLPPFLMAGGRFALAGLLMVAGLAVWRRSALRMTWRQIGTAALAGLLLPLGGNGLVTVAEQGVSSGLAALLISAVPLWIVLLRWAGRDRPSTVTVAGVVVGFVGVALLLSGGITGGHAGSVLLLLVAALSWAVGSYATTRLPMPANPIAGSAVEMIAGGLGLLLLGVLGGEPHRLDLAHVSARSWVAVAYLVVFGSVLAFTCYVWVLGNAPVSTVATYAYVNPAVAAILGALVLSERLAPAALLGGAVILLAVAAIVTDEGRRARAARVLRAERAGRQPARR